MKLRRVGVDLAKNVFQVHGLDRNDFRRRVRLGCTLTPRLPESRNASE